jgi:protocatechuate 3,4-dioxygenase beta subunit
MTHALSRRGFLGLGALFVTAGCPRPSGTSRAPRDAAAPYVAPPTPIVDDGDGDAFAHPAVCAATADNIEGPFFKPGAPHRAVLVGARDAGERLTVSGVVRGADCSALADAELELWHADARGDYDLEGFKFRAALRTGADGAWRIDTIVPGRYLNGARYRPAHIHAKVRARGHRALTTQLYFDGDPYNAGDPFIVESLVMSHHVADGVRRAGFDFVLESA